MSRVDVAPTMFRSQAHSALNYMSQFCYAGMDDASDH